jgi:hypothetical protein
MKQYRERMEYEVKRNRAFGIQGKLQKDGEETIGSAANKSLQGRKIVREAAEESAAVASKHGGQGILKTIGKVTKLGKVVPFVGTVVSGLFWADDVDAKGLGPGTVNTAIDGIPIVGAAKTINELSSGHDWIPDKGQKPYDDPTRDRNGRPRKLTLGGYE